MERMAILPKEARLFGREILLLKITSMPIIAKNTQKIRGMFNSNARFLPNPYNLALKGKNITVYHGMALNDLVELIPGGKYVQHRNGH